MPEIGKRFYESGPAAGIAQLAGYIDAQAKAGVPKVEDSEIAAAQFMESTHAMLFKPIVFNFAPAPDDEQVERSVRIAVTVFLAAYQVAKKV